MTRREMREHTFKMVFAVEFYPAEELPAQVRMYLDECEEIGEEKEELAARMDKIIACVPKLDERLNQVAEGWKTKRMGKADLAIVRLALYEMLYDESIPVKVAINEAVELAKKFGGDDSPSFVNGILAKTVKEA